MTKFSGVSICQKLSALSSDVEMLEPGLKKFSSLREGLKSEFYIRRDHNPPTWIVVNLAIFGVTLAIPSVGLATPSVGLPHHRHIV